MVMYVAGCTYLPHGDVAMPNDIALPLPAAVLIALLVVLLGVSIWLAIRRRRQPLFRAADAVLGSEEREMLGVLQDALAADYVVFPRLRANDVLAPRRRLRRGRRRAVAERLADHFLAFVVCDGRDTRPLAVVELHDPHARQRQRRHREREIATFCSDADLPLLWLSAADEREPAALRAQLDDLLAPPDAGDEGQWTADGRREPLIDLPEDPGEPVR